MTEIESIKELQDNIDLPFGVIVSDEASRMAINALEKQIPKKLKEHTQSQYGCIPVCGVCNGIMDLIQGDLNYCPNCGQKIDWGDGE